jgi:hypothetical protein
MHKVIIVFTIYNLNGVQNSQTLGPLAAGETKK